MEYKHYLATVLKRKVNGYYQDFATIKKFHRIAQLKGEVNNNPFANFKLGREETVKNCKDRSKYKDENMKKWENFGKLKVA